MRDRELEGCLVVDSLSVVLLSFFLFWEKKRISSSELHGRDACQGPSPHHPDFLLQWRLACLFFSPFVFLIRFFFFPNTILLSDGKQNFGFSLWKCLRALLVLKCYYGLFIYPISDVLLSGRS